MNKYLLSAILLLFLSTTHAQEKFSLKNCITYGLTNHRSVAIAKNDRASADAAIREARAGYLPVVAVNSSVDDNLKVQEQVIPAGVLGDQDVRVAFTKQFATTTTIQLDQPLYDHSKIIGLKANKFKKQQAELSAYQTDEELIYNISTAYYQIIIYKQQIDFLDQNSQVYTEQVRILQLQVDKGVLAEVELNKVKVNLNNNASQLRLAQSNLANSINELKNSMGYPLEQPLEVALDGPEPEPALQIENSITAFAASRRLDFQLSEINASLLKIEYQRIRATNLPTLSFYAKYGGTGFGDNLSETFRTVQDFSSIGIKLNAPLFAGFSKRAQYQQARIDYLNAQENLKLDEANYRMESENAKIKLVKAQSSISEEKENIALAESVLKSSTLQYQKGVLNLTEWLNANSSLKDAQNNYLNSVVDFYLARIDIEKANGTLKNYYNTLK